MVVLQVVGDTFKLLLKVLDQILVFFPARSWFNFLVILRVDLQEGGEIGKDFLFWDLIVDWLQRATLEMMKVLLNILGHGNEKVYSFLFVWKHTNPDFNE